MSALTVDSNAAMTLGFPKEKEYRISVGEGLIVRVPTLESADAAKNAEAKTKLLLATVKSTARTEKTTLKMAQAAAAEETATEAVSESKEAAEVAVEKAAEAVIAAEELGGQQ